MESICVCGDEESRHIDGVDQCVMPECGCKGFEPMEDIEIDSD